jgi:hypothetical protein
MNKLAEKISPVMNAAELQQLIADHYQGESQLLTTGAEENLLKLAELRGTLDEARAARWAQIKRDFLRDKAMGAGEADVGQRVVGQLNDLVESVRGLEKLSEREKPAPVVEKPDAPWPQLLASLERLSERLSERSTPPRDVAMQGEAAVPASQPAALPPDWVERLAEQQLQLQQVLTLLAERIAALQGAPAAAPAKRARAMPTEGPALAAALREEQLKQALEEFSDRLLGKPPR